MGVHTRIELCDSQRALVINVLSLLQIAVKIILFLGVDLNNLVQLGCLVRIKASDPLDLSF
jgi:hypothetical protein